ncbi:HlyD family efflux transporter periplasmic adaptor subunit [Oscillochloris sp. ZM17-4]|uniref:HlyD family efflux transporter periplasmic adaptor subunit n=1 Tax=Oscillochloris sp. ZM17-4 TaxID=2866714 RepID=UPI001C736124|nr:HlyD family efflux transporter periplasmic adaptor subunit [Oscillochloris sp. ZM17-4]MBX0326661.1 HlyD family efflux transporter periplasmic adaptor subunit [Oscillochloris sp. ZM17-4]
MATETVGAEQTSAAATPAKRARRLGGRQLALGAVLLIALVIAGTVGFRYWRDATLYISTDDALVDATMQSVTSPGAGTLVIWKAQPGSHVIAGEVIGVVRTTPGLASVSSYNVIAPIDGTLLRVDAHEGQNVSPALPLAYVADLDHLRITAYVDETAIDAVHAGQLVDITVDATGGTPYQGTVSEVIPATAGQFALLPSSDRSTGNFTKVTQRVEVRIALQTTGGAQLYPGENANVRIHR